MHKSGNSIPVFALEVNEPQVNDFPDYLANGVHTNTFNSVASHTWLLLHVTRVTGRPDAHPLARFLAKIFLENKGV